MTSLTDKQREVLDVIRQAVGATGQPPTLREICRVLGRTPCTVQRHLEALERKGAIRREPWKYRGITITGDEATRPPTHEQLLRVARASLAIKRSGATVDDWAEWRASVEALPVNWEGWNEA